MKERGGQRAGGKGVGGRKRKGKEREKIKNYNGAQFAPSYFFCGEQTFR